MMLCAGPLGDPDRFSQLVPLVEQFHPRFGDYLTISRVLAGPPDGPIDTKPIDDIIAGRAELGWSADVLRFSATAADFAPEAKKDRVRRHRPFHRHRAGLARGAQPVRSLPELSQSTSQSANRSPSVGWVRVATPAATVASGISTSVRDSITAFV